MKFTVPAKTFAAVLARVQTIAVQRATMPILSHVLLEASALRPVLHLCATDLEVGYQTAIDCEVDTPGKIAVPAKKLYEVVKASPCAEVELVLNPKSNRVTVSAGTYQVQLAGQDGSDFPAVPALPPGETLQLDAAALLRLVENVEYAQSGDETKYNLCGTFFRAQQRDDEWRLVAAATDGHRMAGDSIPLPGGFARVSPTLQKGIIVARKGVSELGKIKREGILCLDIAGNHLTVSTDSETVTIRLVDGEFPDYQRMIPAAPPCRVEVKRVPLIASLERVALLSTGKDRGVTCRFQEGSILFSASNTDLGEASDRLAVSIEGAPHDVRFNCGYLDQALSALDTALVEIGLSGEIAPVLVTPLGLEEPFAVIMPMRL